MIKCSLLVLWGLSGCFPPKEDPWYKEEFIEEERYERVSKEMSVLESERYVEAMRRDGWFLERVNYPVAEDDLNKCIVIMKRLIDDGNKKTQDTRSRNSR